MVFCGLLIYVFDLWVVVLICVFDYCCGVYCMLVAVVCV